MIELLLQGACDPNKQQNYLQGMSPSRKKKTHVKEFLKKQKNQGNQSLWSMVACQDPWLYVSEILQESEIWEVPGARSTA